jgi:hypothetical protein
MDIDPVPANDVQNPSDIDTTVENTEVEAVLDITPNNLSSITDIGEASHEASGKLSTF